MAYKKVKWWCKIVWNEAGLLTCGVSFKHVLLAGRFVEFNEILPILFYWIRLLCALTVLALICHHYCIMNECFMLWLCFFLCCCCCMLLFVVLFSHLCYMPACLHKLILFRGDIVYTFCQLYTAGYTSPQGRMLTSGDIVHVSAWIFIILFLECCC